MGIFDKLKGAVNFVTGGGARVTLELPPDGVLRGQPVPVRVTVTSTGGVVKSTGVFVDVTAGERIRVPGAQLPASHHPTAPPGQMARTPPDLDLTRQTFEQKTQIAGAFELQANESRVFDGTFQLSTNVQATYTGVWTAHEWRVRARVEVTGNDPDSGFGLVRVV